MLRSEISLRAERTTEAIAQGIGKRSNQTLYETIRRVNQGMVSPLSWRCADVCLVRNQSQTPIHAMDSVTSHRNAFMS